MRPFIIKPNLTIGPSGYGLGSAILLREKFTHEPKILKRLEAAIFRPHIFTLDDGNLIEYKQVLWIAKTNGLTGEWASKLSIATTTATNLAIILANRSFQITIPGGITLSSFFWTPAALVNFFVSCCGDWNKKRRLIANPKTLSNIIWGCRLAVNVCISAYAQLLPAEAVAMSFLTQAQAQIEILSG